MTSDDDERVPAATCPTCTKPMPPAHLICAYCITDGHTPTAADTHNRNARIAEVILWS